MMRTIRALIVAVPLAATVLGAQTPAADPTERLREVLPADVAERVIAKIAAARSRQLPAQALENRVLKFAARGIAFEGIEKALDEHIDRQTSARDAIQFGRPSPARLDEIEAGAEAMRMGVRGDEVSDLARSAPSGRSLAVPLFVIGSMVERGLSSDEALQRVLDRLNARASDVDLERLPNEVGRRGDPRPTRPVVAPPRERPPTVVPPRRPPTPTPERPPRPI
jgi:hypothetical protein